MASGIYHLYQEITEIYPNYFKESLVEELTGTEFALSNEYLQEVLEGIRPEITIEYLGGVIRKVSALREPQCEIRVRKYPMYESYEVYIFPYSRYAGPYGTPAMALQMWHCKEEIIESQRGDIYVK